MAELSPLLMQSATVRALHVLWREVEGVVMLASRGAVSAFAIALAAVAAGAARADPQALSTNVPVEIEDARPVPLGTLFIQPDQRFTRDRATGGGTTDLGQPELSLKLGAAKGLQLDVTPAYNWSGGPQDSNGQARVGGLYQFTQDKGDWLPDLAVRASYGIGYGVSAPSDQVLLRGAATKHLGAGDRAPRLHANVSWTRVLDPAAGDRRDQYGAAVGASFLVAKDTAVVADYAWSQRPGRGDGDQQFIDVGMIHEFSEQWSVGFGAGGGVGGGRQPEGRLFVSLQRVFRLFGG